jgi:hypothetical protein
MRKLLNLVICVSIGSIWPVALPAHHSFASHYDPTRSLELRGTVVNFSYRSPHSFLYLDAPSENGESVTWEIEMASVPLLRRFGIDADTFKLGDEVSVNVWPNRVEGNPLVWGQGFIAADGRALGEFPPTPKVESVYLAANGVARLQGHWRVPVPMFDHTQSPLPLTPAGLAAVQAYDPQESAANRCEPNVVPASYHAPYQFAIEIQGADVVIQQEMYSVTRTIRLATAPRSAEPTGLFGLVTGRIEGVELVVESKGFPASGWGLGTASDELGVGTDIPSSDQKTLVERFSVSDDGQMLIVRYRVQDPVYLTEPYDGVAMLNRVADDEILYPYVCELDSAERFSRDLQR